ncbi:hypothetical protein ACWDZX_21660, partial [Streptomyces collinus]
MSPRAGHAGHPARTLAFVESPVQLLNVLEWAHLHGLRGADPAGPPAHAVPSGSWGATRAVPPPPAPGVPPHAAPALRPGPAGAG